MCAAQTTDILNLRTELASEKARAAAASSIAEQEATKLNQQIAVLTEDSERAVIRAANVSNQLEALRAPVATQNASLLAGSKCLS
jgi:hypothetical protein